MLIRPILFRESCAILKYLVEKYDTARKISVESFEEKAIQDQWLYYQASGQGYVLFLHCFVCFRTQDPLYSPYFGQCGYFKAIGGPEWRIPKVIERYQKEILRVFSVLESVLSKQEWLVGGKCTIADLSFIM